MRPFELLQPETVADALQAAAYASHPQYLAGGTNLLDLMKLDVLRPETVIDVALLRADHGRIEHLPDGLHLGAAVHMAEAADHPVVRSHYPALADALWQAASPQLRNMATLGGNVLQRTRCPYFRDTSWGACNKRRPGSGCAAIEGASRRMAVLGTSEHCIATYPGDFAVALVALSAEVELQGPGGATRRMPFQELHHLPLDTPHLETEMYPAELITGFRVPRGSWTRRSLYLKIRDRSSYDFALASVAVALDLDEQRLVRSAHVGLGGVATKPWRSFAAEQVLTDRVLDEAAAEEAAEAAFADAKTYRDNAFKIELGRRTLVRALLQAAAMEL